MPDETCETPNDPEEVEERWPAPPGEHIVVWRDEEDYPRPVRRIK